MVNLDHIINTIEMIPEPAVVINASSSILCCNKLFMNFVDREEDEIVDETISLFFSSPEVADAFMAQLLKIKDQYEPSLLQSRMINKHGIHLPVLYTVSPFTETIDDQKTFLLIANSKKLEFKPSFDVMFADIPIPFLRIGLDGTILNANEESWIILSYWQREINQQVPEPFLSRLDLGPDHQVGVEIEFQIGYKFFLFVTVSVSVKGYVDIFAFDITQRKKAEKKLEINAQVFESAFEGIVIADAERRIIDVNNAFCTITGYEREEVLGEDLKILRSGKHSPEFYDELWNSVREKGSWQGEIWDRKKGGEIFPKWFSISSIKDLNGEVIRYIGLFSDISVIKKTEEKLYRMANYDALTGLVNRRYFIDQLERALLHAKRLDELLAIMFIDLDGFKHINDSLGHQAGDDLLCIVAKRLKECVRDADIVARMGGDEFIILFPRINYSQDIVKIAEKILKTLSDAVELENSDRFISASIGVAIYPNDAIDAEELIQNADTALYQSKKMGKNIYHFFSPKMNKYAEKKFHIQSRMHLALLNGEFSVYYQPQLDTITNSIIGGEALIRWQLSDDSFESPDLFIPIAEETGLIIEIGDFVLQTICTQAKLWISEGLLDFPISINVSSIQLKRPEFIKRFDAALVASGLKYSNFEIELTERTFVEDAETIQETLRYLKEQGCTLVIDDFGVKYSSLSYLKLLPLDKFKIDKSFVKDLPDDKKSADIVKAVVAMGRSLNLSMIAEGVETREQMDFLKEIDCNCIQGYYFSRPLPADKFHALLKTNKKKIPNIISY